jgi:hypothetical protein
VLDVRNRWCKFPEDDALRETFVLWDAMRMDKVAAMGLTDTAAHFRHKEWMGIQGQ